MHHRLLLLSASVFACGQLSHAAPLDAEALRAASSYSASQRGAALIIVRDGKTILESYGNGAGRSKAGKIYSGTKGFWNLAFLAAQEDGLFDLDEPASRILPEWDGDSQKSRLTIRQLLSFSSGLEAANSLHTDGWEDRNRHALKQAVVGTPGHSFIYGPAALQVVHEILKRRLSSKDESPTRYLERRVLRPMGLGPQRYLSDRDGNPLLAAGFIMPPHDWLRMGRLILKNGSPVLKGSMGDAFAGSDSNPMFSLGFWNNHLAGRSGSREVDPEELLDLKWYRQDWRNTCLSHAAPSDLVASIGSGGQRLYVVPSMHLVIVRQGAISRFSDTRFLRLLFAGT